MTDRRVALVTCREFPNLDDDDRLVLPELAASGITGMPVSWDDESVDWEGFDLAVVRSTWDYVDRPGEFLAWAQSVPRLANPANVLRWNTDKRYLRDLADAGVPVVPTTWLEPGDAVQLPGAEDRGTPGPTDLPMITGVGTIVAKPSIGAGSRDAGRFDLTSTTDRELATKHIQRLLDQGETVMVQPYLEAVDTVGETALLFTGGEFSHAVRKAALLRGPDTDVEGLFREEEITARRPSAAERGLAEAALAAVADTAVADTAPADLLYARVDLLPDADGRPVLLELELSEPSLFLRTDARAASRFAAAIGTRLDRVLKTR